MSKSAFSHFLASYYSSKIWVQLAKSLKKSLKWHLRLIEKKLQTKKNVQVVSMSGLKLKNIISQTN